MFGEGWLLGALLQAAKSDWRSHSPRYDLRSRALGSRGWVASPVDHAEMMSFCPGCLADVAEAEQFIQPASDLFWR